MNELMNFITGIRRGMAMADARMARIGTLEFYDIAVITAELLAAAAKYR